MNCFQNNFIDLNIQLIVLSFWVNLPEFFFLSFLPEFSARILPEFFPHFARISGFQFFGGHSAPPPRPLRLWQRPSKAVHYPQRACPPKVDNSPPDNPMHAGAGTDRTRLLLLQKLFLTLTTPPLGQGPTRTTLLIGVDRSSKVGGGGGWFQEKHWKYFENKCEGADFSSVGTFGGLAPPPPPPIPKSWLRYIMQ